MNLKYADTVLEQLACSWLDLAWLGYALGIAKSECVLIFCQPFIITVVYNNKEVNTTSFI